MNEMHLPGFVKTAIQLLEKSGFLAFVVGGCVRDFLMGITPSDYDITTNALPHQTIEVFKDFTVIETGIAHGTVTVRVDKQNLEITTFRIDGDYEDNRHPKSVEFSSTLKDDLKRRDFTINAIAYNEKLGFVDEFGGSLDIKNKKIRCVGNANLRFNEDGLRILRALRFASRLGFEIESETSNAILSNKSLLLNISAERIYSEFCGILLGEYAQQVLLNYKEVISQIVPEIEPCINFEQNSKYHSYDVYTHIVKTIVATPKDKVLRLTAFFHDIAKPESYFLNETGGHFYGHEAKGAEIAKNVLKRFKADNKTIFEVSTLVEYHDKPLIAKKRNVKRLIQKLDFKLSQKLLDIKRADLTAHALPYAKNTQTIDSVQNLIDEIISQNLCLNLKDLKITGKDLIEIGFEEGKEVGKVLNILLDLVVEEKIQNEFKILKCKAKELLNKKR